jgi:hypothetical protein
MLLNALMLFLTEVWIGFSTYEAQILGGNGNFTLPGSQRGELDTIDIWFYQAIPFVVAVLLACSSACLIATLRLSR